MEPLVSSYNLNYFFPPRIQDIRTRIWPAPLRVSRFVFGLHDDRKWRGASIIAENVLTYNVETVVELSVTAMLSSRTASIL